MILKMFNSNKPISLPFYIIGLIVIIIAVSLPYFFEFGQVLGYLIVYGIPIVVVSTFFGKQILSRAAKNRKNGFRYSFGFFSSFFLLGIIVASITLMIILQLYPSALDLIKKTNPALDVNPQVAWIMIAVSMLVIGPAEEYLFRGFIYGGMLSVSKGRFWFPLAIVSSLVFTFVHWYYALTYQVASPIFFIQLFTFGIAMCLTYYYSGGNLLGPAIVHGLNDAIGFLGVATASDTIRLTAQGMFIFVGFVFAIFFVIKKVRMKPFQNQPEITNTSPQSQSLPP
jgi:membrane protease YdiL (CAAX protease family)